MKYIALLRGINVGGHNKIKMEALQKALEPLPFSDLSTYIQSGNILFDSAISSTSQIAQLINQVIQKEFGLQIAVIVVTAAELSRIVTNNPFPEIEDPVQPYVTFLSDIPSTADIEALQKTDFGNDRFMLVGKALYIVYDVSAAKTKLANTIIEKKLKVQSTARNWKTVQKLLELCQQ